MKYPFVIFYRLDKYSEIDLFFLNVASLIDCTLYIANTIENTKMLHDSNYHMLVTYGENNTEYRDKLLTVLSEEMLQSRWIHLQNGSIQNIETFNHIVNNFYINMCSLSREHVRPTFSLFTSSYNSGNKIFRVYNSLLKQTLIDWEWVILDDSPDDNNFDFLRKNFINDPRIRLYRRAKNNGSIGNVKNETIGLCRGKYVLEMDHDDELMPDVLKTSADIFNNNEKIGFIYWDCASIYENGKNQWFGDFICKGYGSYYSQKLEDGKWRLVYITPNINNITMTHLVCCPNHPRIWRKSVLNELGSYSEYLPICDDYEIIVKTSISTGIAKVHRIGYIQYMNDSNNNFSLIRNWEINRIGPYYISPIYYDKYNIDNKMMELGAYEDPIYKSNCSKIWQRDPSTYTHKFNNLIINDKYDKQICIIGLDTLVKNLEEIKQLYNDEKTDFILLDTKCSLEYLWKKLEYLQLDKMKCYYFEDETNDNLEQWFKLLYLSTKEYYIYRNDELTKPLFNSTLNTRYNIINKYINTHNFSYLEIGVEYGTTILNVKCTNKTGVDPEPKFLSPSDINIIKETSDTYFLQLDKTILYNGIFIDGMHQIEYFIRDIYNASNHLTNNGTIFIDDILPFCYYEQLKIPISHYYENGIIKYGEFWTGDIWKGLYHILLYYRSYINYIEYYYNANFRGICVLTFNKSLPEKILDQIHLIDNYDYFTDFPKYMDLLNVKTILLNDYNLD